MNETLRFYLHKIGGHLQELAVLAAVFVPLDAHSLSGRQIAVVCVASAVMLFAGIEIERRTK